MGKTLDQLREQRTKQSGTTRGLIADAVLELADELQVVRRQNAPIGGENDRLRASLAPVKPQTLKLYVVEYSFFRAFVMAENADKAREYVRGETDGSAAAFKTTPIDMTKPGVLRR